MTVELLLVRHAVAFERDRARWPDDTQRPLTREGRAKFRRAAAGLAKWLRRPDRVLTSPLVRARQTAEILAQAARWPKAIEAAELSPDGPPAEVIRVLRTLKGASLAVVGHEPALSALLAFCVGGADGKHLTRMKKGGVALIVFPARPQAGAGSLAALVPPRVLRKL